MRERKKTGVTHLSSEATRIADALKADLETERGIAHSRATVVAEALAFFQRYRLSMPQGPRDATPR